MSDAIVRELIKEIKADRAERKAQFDRIELRLTTLEGNQHRSGEALAALSRDLKDFRDKVFDNESDLGERIRRVSDFTGMTDPHGKNGGE